MAQSTTTLIWNITVVLVLYFMIFIPGYLVGRLEATCDEDEKKQYGYAIVMAIMIAFAYFGFNGYKIYKEYKA